MKFLHFEHRSLIHVFSVKTTSVFDRFSADGSRKSIRKYAFLNENACVDGYYTEHDSNIIIWVYLDSISQVKGGKYTKCIYPIDFGPNPTSRFCLCSKHCSGTIVYRRNAQHVLAKKCSKKKKKCLSVVYGGQCA